MPFRPGFTLGSGGRGHRPAAPVAVSGANRGDCGRGFPGCRSRGGGAPSPGPVRLFPATPDYLIQCQFSTVMVRSSCSCFGCGTVLKKSSPVRSSTRSTVTTKGRRLAELPLLGSTNAIIFSGRGIVDDLVIILRHGNPVYSDGNGLFCREDRPGHHDDSLLPRCEMPDLLLQLAPNPSVELGSLGRHIAYIETLRHRFCGERHVGGRGKMPAIIAGPSVVLRGSRAGRDLRIGPEVVASFCRPPRDLLASHDMIY